MLGSWGRSYIYQYQTEMKFLILVTLVVCSFAINLPCATTQQCPTNSYCQPNNMCACNTGFIGDCTTAANSLTSDSISLVLQSNKTTFFYTEPQELDTFIEFTFQVCLDQPNQVNTYLTLWGETGNITAYNLVNALGNPTSATLTSGCQQFITPYISFGSQPNGLNQMLVLGIRTGSASAFIDINVTQQQSSGFFVYYYILIAIVVIVFVVVIIGAFVFIIRKRRRNLAQGIVPAVPVPAFNKLEHFQNFMPNFIAQKLGSQKVVCSICLQQVEFNETVRQTPCKHVFHSTCIDSWCLKNLTCPVCRSELTLESMADESRRSSFNNSLHDRVQLQERNQRVQYRASMIQPQPSIEVNQQVQYRASMIQPSMEVRQEDGRYVELQQGKYEIRQSML